MSDSKKRRRQSEPILDTDHLQSRLRAKALRGGGFTLISQVLSFGIQTIGAIVLARLLKPADFGLVAMVAAFLFLVQNFGLNGFVEAVVQQDKISNDQLSKLFWINCLIMLGLTLVFMCSSPLIALFYKEPQIVKVCIVMSLSILIGGFRTCHFALLARNMDFHLTSLAILLSTLVSTVIAIGAAIEGLGVWALVSRQISEPLLTASFVWLFCPWRPGFPSKGTDIRHFLRFGVRTYGSFLIDYLRKSISGMSIGRIFGRITLGYYERADQLSTVFPQMTSQIAGVGIATLSRLKDEPQKYLDYLAKALSVLAVFSLPFGYLTALFGKEVVILLLGTPWSKAGDLVAALGPAIGFMVIYDANLWIHISLGRPDRLLRWGATVIFFFLIFILGGSLFGVVGVAVGQTVLYHLLVLPALVFAGRPMRIRAPFYLSVILKYWLAAFASASLLWLVLHAVGPTAIFFNHLASIVRISAGCVLYALIYLVLGRFLFKEMRPLAFFFSILREMWHRQAI
jgi:PST family polysaccharide transporter